MRKASAVAAGARSWTTLSPLWVGAGLQLHRAPVGPSETVLVKLATHESYGESALERELQLSERLECRQIARVLGLGAVAGQQGLVLEDIGGTLLAKRLESGPLPLRRAVEIAVDVAAALDALHRTGYVHAGIAPYRIVANDDRAQLIDLSTAAQTSSRRSEFGPLNVHQALQYSAPEQTGRVNRCVDARADLYALGIVLYELLRGTTPFAGLTGIELVHAHIAVVPNIEQELCVAAADPSMRAVAQMILRLLQKDPDDRYQSAAGIMADLDTWLTRGVAANDTAAPLNLGQHDRPTCLPPVQQLVGRAAEIETLARAFASVRGGGRALTLVSGPSGVGKSALVRELYEPLTAAHGTFLVGKFDQARHDIPYSAFVQALRQFCRQLLAEDEREQRRWRNHLREALGHSAKPLMWLLPDLTALLELEVEPGATPTGEVCGLLIRALTAISEAGRPVVLFLDDLQWTDEASQNLLRELAVLPGFANIHFVASYRAGELPGDHPVLDLAKRWQAQNVEVSTLKLAPLGLRDVAELLARSLRRPQHETVVLSEIIHQTTDGNPFFIAQLLEKLATLHLVRYDESAARWTWDEEAIRHERYSANVLEFVGARLQALAPEVFDILQRAATLGSSVPFDLLSMATSLREPVLRARLEDAEREGLIRLDAQVVAAGVRQTALQISFVHDHIQHALIHSVADASQLSATIGRRLIQRRAPRSDDPWLFVIVAQLNAGLDDFKTTDDRWTVARWNAVAASRAYETGALARALSLAERGIALLGPGAFALDYALSLDLYSTACEAAAGTSQLQRLEELAQLVDSQVRQPVDASRVWCAQVRGHVAHGIAADGVKLGAQRLHKLGIELDALSESAFAPIDLAALEVVRAPIAEAAMRLLSHMGSGAYVGDRPSFPSIVATLTRLLRRYGISPHAAPGVSWTATLLLSQRRYEEAYEWGQTALRLSEQLDHSGLICQTRFAATVSGDIARDHIRRHSERYKEQLRFAAETGNFEYCGWIAMSALQFTVLSGQPLEEVLTETPGLLRHTTSSAAAGIATRIWAQLAECLAGHVAAAHELKGRYIDWEQVQPVFEREHALLALSMLATARIILAIYMGRYDEACAIADATEHLREGELGIGGFLVRMFYAPAARLFSINGSDAEAHAARIALARRDLEELRAWARTAPHNANHRLDLLEAELARIGGDDLRALALYDSAIHRAQMGRHTHDAALACERSAELLRNTGCNAMAQQLRASAMAQYRKWGAVNKPGVGHVRVTEAAQVRLDRETVTKAVRTLSRVVDRAELVRTLVGLALENAGAELGCYISLREPWTVEAYGWVSGKDITVRSGSDHTRVSWSAVKYVNQFGRTLVVDRAQSSELSEDTYIEQNDVVSLLCLPIKGADGVVGVLYLENNLVEGAFSEEHVDTLTLLAAQLAASLEVAALYAELTQTIVELEHSNAQLEDFVAITSHDLREPLRTIGSYAQVLELTQTNADPETKKVVAWIVRGVARMSALLDDIRDYTRSFRTDEDITEVDLGSLCDSVSEHLAHSIKNTLAEIVHGALPVVKARAGDLQLVLLNLFSNAMKFRGTQTPKIVVHCEANENEHIIVVDDNGIGIPAEFRHQVFERFRRLFPRDKYEGSGLGLATCQRIVQRSGGRIWCEQSPMGGASFRFTIPRNPGASAARSRPSSTPELRPG